MQKKIAEILRAHGEANHGVQRMALEKSNRISRVTIL